MAGCWIRRGLRLGIVGLVSALLLSLPLGQAASARAWGQRLAAQALPPQPGETIYLRVRGFERPPPAGLEPPDPYHRPFAWIWPTVRIRETWIEVGEGGRIARWHSIWTLPDGTVWQETLGAGSTDETRFPLEGSAIIVNSAPGTFRDPRAAVAEQLLREAGSVLEAQTPEGRAVRAFVGPWRRRFPRLPSIPEALLQMSSPFLADLHPVADRWRADQDPADGSVVGTGWEILGADGSVTLARYEALEGIRHDPPGQAPEEAFRWRTPA